jgi:hypothetical protein
MRALAVKPEYSFMHEYRIPKSEWFNADQNLYICMAMLRQPELLFILISFLVLERFVSPGKVFQY